MALKFQYPVRMPFIYKALKGIQKFHSRLRFFPDFDISMPFNAHVLIELQISIHFLLFPGLLI